jgi:hypothetical protein
MLLILESWSEGAVSLIIKRRGDKRKVEWEGRRTQIDHHLEELLVELHLYLLVLSV